MNTPHKWAEVIKAWADGKPIQSRHVSSAFGTISHLWTDFLHESVPDFNNNDIEWRIKPTIKFTCWSRLVLVKYNPAHYKIELINHFGKDVEEQSIDWDQISIDAFYTNMFVRWLTDPMKIEIEE